MATASSALVPEVAGVVVLLEAHGADHAVHALALGATIRGPSAVCVEVALGGVLRICAISELSF